MNKEWTITTQKIAKAIIKEAQVKQMKKIIKGTRRLMKKYREFKMTKNNLKSRAEYAELCKGKRKCITEELQNLSVILKNILENKT